jgi:hypothetical protein
VQTIITICIEAAQVFQEAAVYVLLGFMVAGLMRMYISAQSVAHYFTRGRFRSVVYASILGIPLPL